MKILLNPDILPSSTFACGPAQGHPSLRHTPLDQTLFERSHRAADISAEGLYKEAAENARALLSVPPDYTVLFFLGGATPAMDAVLWNLTKDSLSGLAFGAFSKRWTHEMAARLENTLRLSVRETEAGEFFPRQKPDYQASLVVLTPNETSTGVQMPNDYLEEAWSLRGRDTLIAWDCTSCAGGRVLPAGKFDVMLFGMQKCFGTGGGSSVLILSPAAVKRLEETKNYRAVPYSLDLKTAVRFAKNKYQTSNTPNTTNIWMFNEACKWMLSCGGLPAMEALCKQHAQYLLDWAAQTDYLAPLIKDEKLRSFTSLTLEITDPAVKDSDISAALHSTGLPNLADGIKKYSSVAQNSVRIACFPFVDINGTGEYEKLTRTVDEIVRQLRAKK
ncbi:MAG: aminotransferase class V-fold PLP-dependent enzyme [Candidatus Avelusimicrobium sp.]|uniref:aminotransferase class V-fold PLP-dependent enzyme n=1 Tax=Candidatus Avelusimicrobium sp. TaxID=3048833 RepID=UPI003F032F2F